MEKDALHIVQQILFNAYVLYKSNTSEKVMSRLQFLQEVIYGLALSYPNEPTAPVQLCQTPENSKLVKLVGTYLFMNKFGTKSSRHCALCGMERKILKRILQAATAFGFVIFLESY